MNLGCEYVSKGVRELDGQGAPHPISQNDNKIKKCNNKKIICNYVFPYLDAAIWKDYFIHHPRLHVIYESSLALRCTLFLKK